MQQNLDGGQVREHEGTSDSVVVFEVEEPQRMLTVPRQTAPQEQQDAPAATFAYRTLPLDSLFNANVTDIFHNEYLSPRSPFTTLALPKQGIGDWCSTRKTADIDDTALRSCGGIITVAGVPFAAPAEGRNIIFTSLWDNYPDSVTLPLQGRASRISLLMAGSTNPMQSQFDNGEIIVTYSDGTTERLALRNPDNWFPIEQDYADVAWLQKPRPFRLALKTGRTGQWLGRDCHPDTAHKGRLDLSIPGGAAQLLHIDTDSAKTLRSITVRTTANDVVIGLLGLSLGTETAKGQKNL